MKHIFLGILLLISDLIYADGLDEMRIYVNHHLVATSYEGGSQLLELNVSEGDTLSFEMWTDWGGMENGTLSVFDYISSESVLQLTQIPDNKYEARFEQIIKPDFIGSELLYVFNFSQKVNRTWKFARIVLKTIKK